jgi:hypothetical protein
MTVNLFDSSFYRLANPDLAPFSDQDLLSHFQNFGLNEGRTFSPLVDLNYYRASNSDLGRFSPVDLFNHLANFGVAEGRTFSPLVDLNYYRLVNGNLANFNSEQLFTDLQTSGIRDGRQFSLFVDLGFYRLANQDLQGFDNVGLFNHLNLAGLQEGRRISPLFDLGFYLNLNPSLNNLLQGNQRLALEHLQTSGLNEGLRFSPIIDLEFYKLANPNLPLGTLSNRDLLNRIAAQDINTGERFSLTYTTNFYRQSSPDLVVAGFNNQDLFEHFQAFGLREGRASSEAFNVQTYLANSPDLVAVGFGNKEALEHFAVFGFKENRIASTATFIVSQDPSDVLANATDLGVINNRLGAPLQERLGNGDRDDLYKFTIAYANTVRVTLNSLGGASQAQLLYDRNLNSLIEANEIIEIGSLGAATSFTQDLEAGVYYISVSTSRTDTQINYTLGLVTTPLSLSLDTDPGESISSAFLLSNLAEPLVVQDFIGISDLADIYRFDVTTNSSVDISINGLNGSDSVDAQLIFDSNGNGEIDTEFISSDSSTSAIFLGKNLGVGTYYIRVQPTTITQGSAYSLRIVTNPLPDSNPLNDPGSSFATAFNLGFLQGNINLNQFVGSADRRDVYRFILSTGTEPVTNINFNLSNLTELAEAQLVFDRNGNNTLDSSDTVTILGRSTSAITSSQSLETGNYFVLINSANFQSNTSYSLSIGR